ncbi:MAG: PIG-L family deacetylase, partial [Acidimicrobiales bacterium]|nr:PIG-L family deacetylase [Acidimicrobiales bacterium]
FATVDRDAAAARLAGLLEEERADLLVIYDENGVYGHPDHVQVYEVGHRAADLAATPALYLVTLDRDRMLAMAESTEFTPPDEPDRDLGTMGVQGWRITTELDVRPWITRKREAMVAHRSQIAPDSFFLDMTDEMFTDVWGTECYIRVRPEAAPGDPGGGRESALALDAAASAGSSGPPGAGQSG